MGLSKHQQLEQEAITFSSALSMTSRKRKTYMNECSRYDYAGAKILCKKE
jgi:hypothetical protein